MLTRLRCCSIILLAALVVGSMASSAGAWTMTSRHTSISDGRYTEIKREVVKRWVSTALRYRLPSLWNPEPVVKIERSEHEDVSWMVNCGPDFNWDWDLPYIKKIWEWKRDHTVPVPEPTAALVFAAGIGVASLRTRSRSRRS